VLLGLTNTVFHRSVRCSAFCPSLTFNIKQQNMFCTLVLRSAAVAGGDEQMKSPTAQMPNVMRNSMAASLIATMILQEPGDQ